MYMTLPVATVFSVWIVQNEHSD